MEYNEKPILLPFPSPFKEYNMICDYVYQKDNFMFPPQIQTIMRPEQKSESTYTTFYKITSCFHITNSCFWSMCMCKGLYLRFPLPNIDLNLFKYDNLGIL